MTPLWERVGAKLRINLHAGQALAHAAMARIILVLSGTQSGKTSYGPIWLWREIMRCGPGDYLAASANYDVLRLKMLPELTNWFVGLWGWTYAAGDRVFLSPDGLTKIILRSADAPAGLESATAKAAWLDEWGMPSVGIECWEAVLRRLSIAQGRVLITTTPYNMGWIKQIHDRAVGGNPDYALVNFRSIDNPAFPIAEYERAKREMPDWRFDMFYNGKLTKPAGLIYTDFEDSYGALERIPDPNDPDRFLPGPGRYVSGGCLVQPFSIPAHWLRTVGVDFGASVNNAQVWIADDPVTRLAFVYREVCGVGKPSAEQAREAADYREPVRVAFGGARSEDERRLEWAMAGFPVVEPLITDVEAGIDRVTGHWRQRSMFVFDTLTGVRSELGTYSREVDAMGEPLEKIADKERFHRLDALRAAASGFPLFKRDERMPEVVVDPHPRSPRAIQSRTPREPKRAEYGVH